MEPTSVIIVICVGVGFFFGLFVGRGRERRKFDTYVNKLFIEYTLEELLKVRKEARKILNIRGN